MNHIGLASTSVVKHRYSHCALRHLDSAKIARRRFSGPSIRFNIERDFLSFGETVHPRTLNGADVNEHIFAAVAWLDETKALLTVEPLYSTLHHNSSFKLGAYCARP
jgi:hypothetical protein